MLQPSITNGIIAILKIKSALCGETPCTQWLLEKWIKGSKFFLAIIYESPCNVFFFF